MKKNIKMFLIITLIISLLLPSYLIFADNNGNEISLNEAKKIAISFIKSDIKFKEIKTMYDLDDLPSAYLVELVNNIGNDSGYIIVSASKNNVPIIEFSYDLKPFIEGAIDAAKIKTKDKYNKVKDDCKLYYLGSLDYFVEVSVDDQISAFYDTMNGMVTELDKKDLKRNIVNNETSEVEIETEWTNLLEASESNPPTSGYSPITSPDLYESAYTSSTSGNVTSYNLTYKRTSDFSGYSGHCAPTAGVNMAMYWCNRGYGIWKYFYTDRGVSTAYYDDSNVSNADIKSSITTYNRPFALYMARQYYYCPNGAHEVLALGWKAYVYSSGYNSMYIRIADGWTNYASRFIHKEIGTEVVAMSNVYPQ